MLQRGIRSLALLVCYDQLVNNGTSPFLSDGCHVSYFESGTNILPASGIKLGGIPYRKRSQAAVLIFGDNFFLSAKGIAEFIGSVSLNFFTWPTVSLVALRAWFVSPCFANQVVFLYTHCKPAICGPRRRLRIFVRGPSRPFCERSFTYPSQPPPLSRVTGISLQHAPQSY